MRSGKNAPLWTALLITLTLALPTGQAIAEDADSGGTPQVQPAAAEASVATAAPAEAAGLVVFIDPATGLQTSSPSDEQRAAMQAALAAALDRSEEGIYDVYLPDGSVMRDLQGRFQHALVAKVAPDGGLRYRCVTSVAGAEAPTVATAAPRAETPAVATAAE